MLIHGLERLRSSARNGTRASAQPRVCMPSSAGRCPGESSALVGAAALLAGERIRGDQARERERVARPAFAALRRRAGGRRAATAPRGSPARRHRGGAGGGRIGAGAAGSAGSSSAASAGAAAEDEALGQRVRRQPVGAVQARAGALADGVEPGQRRAAVEVRPRFRPSCSAPRGRPAPRSRGGSRPASASAGSDVREAVRSIGPHVEPDGARAAAAQLGLDRQRDLVARRQLVDEPLARSRRAAARPRRARPR